MGSVFGPVRFLLPVCRLSWFLDTLNIYAHFLSNYWWQKSDIWSQSSYRYPILWEAFFDLSDSYFLFAKERGYHRWALAHSSSCFFSFQILCHDGLKTLVAIFKIMVSCVALLLFFNSCFYKYLFLCNFRPVLWWWSNEFRSASGIYLSLLW